MEKLKILLHKRLLCMNSASRSEVLSKKWNSYDSMTRVRTFKLPWTRKRLAFSLAEVAGHSSFLLLAISYLESDPFYLRGVAIAGLSSMTVFQYFRPQPLWLPIRWNALFIGINSVMICKLLIEKRHESLGDVEQALFDKIFRPAGFSVIEFMYLISAATVITEEDPGIHHVATQGQVQESMGLILSGNLDVTLSDDTIANTLGPHQFFGEMAFLARQKSSVKSNLSFPVASANVVTNGKPVSYMKWKYTDLIKLFDERGSNMSKCMQTALASDLMLKLKAQNQKRILFGSSLPGKR